jgi:peptidoglycan hydrolase CwlO-like protein
MSGDALGAILTMVTALQEGVARLERSQEKLESNQEKLERNQEKLERNQEKLERGHERLRIDVMERMDRLDNALTSIRDDITVNMGRADHAHEVADSTRREVRLLGEQVNAMVRQIQRLQTDVRHLKGEP